MPLSDCKVCARIIPFGDHRADFPFQYDKTRCESFWVLRYTPKCLLCSSFEINMKIYIFPIACERKTTNKNASMLVFIQMYTISFASFCYLAAIWCFLFQVLIVEHTHTHTAVVNVIIITMKTHLQTFASANEIVCSKIQIKLKTNRNNKAVDFWTTELNGCSRNRANFL